MSDTQTEYYKPSSRLKTTSLILIVIGVLSVVYGFTSDAHRTWANFLLGSYYFLTMSLSAVFFLAIHYVTGSRWSDTIRRIPEAMSSYIPIGGILLFLIYFGLHDLYHWSHAEAVATDKILAGKAIYLNAGFFMARLVVFVALWGLFGWMMRKNSVAICQTGETHYYRKNVVVSVLFLFAFAFSFSMASFDWIMSLEPHQFSTIFGIYNFAGMFVSGLVGITLIVYHLKGKGHLTEVNDNHLHDLGKLIFAFSIFWAYIWFSQFLLMWYANIPEETIYFFRRMQPEYAALFFTNIVMNFVIPFFVLLPRGSKRCNILKMVCVLLIAGRWLDLYVMIMPGTLGDHAQIGLLELGIFAGFAGSFIYFVAHALAKHPLVCVKSPYYERCVKFHQ